jgi:hypothetical protein
MSDRLFEDERKPAAVEEKEPKYLEKASASAAFDLATTKSYTFR